MSKPTIHLRPCEGGLSNWLCADASQDDDSHIMANHLIGAHLSRIGGEATFERRHLARFTRLAALHGWEVKVHDATNPL